MSVERPVRKYKVSFEIELYEGSAGEALARTCGLLPLVAAQLDQNGVLEALDGEHLPSSGLTGAPHSAALDGWRCLWTVGRG